MLEKLSLRGSGALNFVEFMAAMMADLPDIYCSHSSLKAVFHFLDSSGGGVIRGEHLHTLFPARQSRTYTIEIIYTCLSCIYILCDPSNAFHTYLRYI